MHPLIWTPQAEADLAAVWLSAPNPQAVTNAAHQVEQFLMADPFGRAVYVAEGLWRLNVRPLVVFFETEPSRTVIRINQVSFLG
jgi:hypothetical protein